MRETMKSLLYSYTIWTELLQTVWSHVIRLNNIYNLPKDVENLETKSTTLDYIKSVSLINFERKSQNNQQLFFVFTSEMLNSIKILQPPIRYN